MSVAEQSLRAKIGRVAAASAIAFVMAELVTFGQTIALARLLTPAQVGFFAAGTVLISFLGNFVEGGLRSNLIYRERSLDDANETVFWATLLGGILMALGTLMAAPAISWVFHNPTAGHVAAAMSGVVVLYALTNVPEALLQRQFSVVRRLVVSPTVSLTFAVVSVVLAVNGFGVWSMVIGSYVSNLVWVVIVWAVCGWRPGRGRASVRMWREQARFGFPLLLGLMGDRVQKVAQAGVTGGLLGAAGVGFLRYGERMARIPVNAMVEVGSNSLFPAFARIAADPRRMKDGYLRALGLVTAIAAPLTALLLGLGEPAVVLVFGEKWRGAGVVLTAMAGLGVGKALMTVSEEAIKGAGRTRLLNWCTGAELVLGVLLLVVLIGPLGLVGVGLSVSVTAVSVGTLMAALARPVTGASWRDLGRTVGPPVVVAALLLCLLVPAERLFVQADTRGIAAGLAALAGESLVFLAVYVGLLAVVAPASLRDLASAVGTVARRARGAGSRRPADAATRPEETDATQVVDGV